MQRLHRRSGTATGRALDALRPPGNRHRTAARALARDPALRPVRGRQQLPARLLPPFGRPAPAVRWRRDLRRPRPHPHPPPPPSPTAPLLPPPPRPPPPSPP